MKYDIFVQCNVFYLVGSTWQVRHFLFLHLGLFVTFCLGVFWYLVYRALNDVSY